MRQFLLAATLALGACLAFGQAQNPQIQAGLEHFYNLEYNRAVADFEAVAAAQPDSAAAWNHLSQAQLYREMYRMGELESELYGKSDPFLQAKPLPPSTAAEQAFLASNRKAVAAAQAAIARNPADAHAHYDLASAWGLRGNYDFSLRHSYFAALSDAKNARREAERARALAPTFEDPVLILGVHNYVAGSLPWTARWFSSLLGYSGNKELGRQQIAAVAASGANDRTDAAVLLFVIDRRDGLNREAAPVLARLQQAYPRNVLFAVEEGEALEAAGEHDSARAQFQAVVNRAAQGAPGYQRAPLGQVWYDLGNLEEVFSRWQAAAADYDRAQAAPGVPPELAQAAAQAGVAARRHGGELR